MEHQINKKNVSFIVLLIFVILINVFIIVESCIPGNESAAQSDWLTKLIADILHIEPTSDLALFIRKAIGHFGLFFINGIFASITMNSYRKHYRKIDAFISFILCLAFGFVIAGISELIQLFVPGRSGAWADVGIDTSGFLLGQLIVLLILFIIHKIKAHKETKAKQIIE